MTIHALYITYSKGKSLQQDEFNRFQTVVVTMLVVVLMYVSNSVLDSVMMMSGYSDVIVIRHPTPGVMTVRL